MASIRINGILENLEQTQIIIEKLGELETDVGYILQTTTSEDLSNNANWSNQYSALGQNFQQETYLSVTSNIFSTNFYVRLVRVPEVGPQTIVGSILNVFPDLNPGIGPEIGSITSNSITVTYNPSNLNDYIVSGEPQSGQIYVRVSTTNMPVNFSPIIYPGLNVTNFSITSGYDAYQFKLDKSSNFTINGLTSNTGYYINITPLLNIDDYYLESQLEGIFTMTTSDNEGGGGMGGGGMGGGGAGAGSDPYITTFSGYTFELPHLNKHWELFSHKPTDFSIIAHTHNYPHGNYFNQVKISFGNQKATIDYQKKKITTNNSVFKVGKTELTMKYNKKGEIVNETKLFDCIVFSHPVFEEIVLLVNWRNDYFHPMFKVKPTKDCSGLLMMKEPSKTL